MYNRYIPGQNGVYQCKVVQDKPAPVPIVPEPVTPRCMPEPEPCPPPPPPQSCCTPPPLSFLKRLLPKDVDLGDIIILLILALLLIDGEESDSTTLILTVVAFLFL